jgi:hypothetical protein
VGGAAVGRAGVWLASCGLWALGIRLGSRAAAGATRAGPQQAHSSHQQPKRRPIARPHLADVHAQLAVDARALDAQQYAQVEGGPVRVGHAAVCAAAVAGGAAQPLQRLRAAAHRAPAAVARPRQVACCGGRGRRGAEGRALAPGAPAGEPAGRHQQDSPLPILRRLTGQAGRQAGRGALQPSPTQPTHLRWRACSPRCPPCRRRGSCRPAASPQTPPLPCCCGGCGAGRVGAQGWRWGRGRGWWWCGGGGVWCVVACVDVAQDGRSGSKGGGPGAAAGGSEAPRARTCEWRAWARAAARPGPRRR